MNTASISILTSEKCFPNKPTNQEVAETINNMKAGFGKREETIQIGGLLGRIEEGRIIFPACSVTGFAQIQAFFFDFDNAGEKHIPKASVLLALKKCGLVPNIVYDTFSSSKVRNRFRLVFVLKDVITNQDKADEIKSMFLELLEKYGVDKNVKTTSGVIFGGTNAEVLYDEFYSEAKIYGAYDRIIKKMREVKPYVAQSLMLPTAKVFSYALNLVDEPTYKQIKSKAQPALRLLKKDSNPVDMDFDDDISKINLSVLKVVYTLHCQGKTTCENLSKQEYSVSVANIAEFLHQNLYAKNMQKIKSILESYENLVAIVGENELFYPMKNVLDGKTIFYGGRYFNWLKSNLFKNMNDTEPKEHTHNIMLKGHAFAKGNNYGELLAEQLLQSFLWAGELQKYVGISVKTLIERTPQFRSKLEGLRTANERNTYIERALKAMEEIIHGASSFPTIHPSFDIEVPKVTTSCLDKRINLKHSNKWDEEAFLRDMGF